MIALLCSWFIIALVFISWGDMAITMWNRCSKQGSRYSVFDTFWIGICTVGLLLAILSIFVPLNFYLLIGFISVSVVYAVWQRQRLAERMQSILVTIRALPLWVKLGWVVAFVAILMFGLTTPLLYDEGLYHLQSMMWSEQYRVIPGLGNLHGRLAFNSVFLLLSTLFNHHPEHYLQFFSLNSLSLLVFGTWVMMKINQSKDMVARAILSLILLLCIFFFGMYLSSTSTDILAHLLVIYLLFSSIIEGDKLSAKPILFFVLPIFCITLKLSFVLVGLFALAVFIQLIINKEYKILVMLIGIGLAIVVPWLSRFVLLSGYLVYPFAAIDIFSFDWKIPIDQVQLEKDLAYIWPIASDMDPAVVLKMPLTQWLPLWINGQSIFNLALYVLALISPLVVLAGYFVSQKTSAVYLAWSIAFLGCMFGFFTAPDPRFGFSFIICGGLIPFLLFTQGNVGIKKQLYISKLATAIPFLLILALLWLANMGYNQTKYYQSSHKPMYTLLYTPQSIDYKKIERNSKFLKQHVGNIIMYYPDNSNQCYDQCLPCLPYLNGDIELRGNDMTDGFRQRQ